MSSVGRLCDRLQEQLLHRAYLYEEGDGYRQGVEAAISSVRDVLQGKEQDAGASEKRAPAAIRKM
jgi:hypothetical protein